MYDSGLTNFSFWWIVPVVMMILCFFMMRGRRGIMMRGCGSRGVDNRKTRDTSQAMEILERRYASGEINKEEFLEKKRTLSESNNFITD